MAKKLLDAGCAAVCLWRPRLVQGGCAEPCESAHHAEEQLPMPRLLSMRAWARQAMPRLPWIGCRCGADDTAIAAATDPEKMAASHETRDRGRRLAYLAGRMPKRLYASSTKSLTGVVR